MYKLKTFNKDLLDTKYGPSGSKLILIYYSKVIIILSLKFFLWQKTYRQVETFYFANVQIAHNSPLSMVSQHLTTADFCNMPLIVIVQMPHLLRKPNLPFFLPTESICRFRSLVGCFLCWPLHVAA